MCFKKTYYPYTALPIIFHLPYWEGIHLLDGLTYVTAQEYFWLIWGEGWGYLSLNHWKLKETGQIDHIYSCMLTDKSFIASQGDKQNICWSCNLGQTLSWGRGCIRKNRQKQHLRSKWKKALLLVCVRNYLHRVQFKTGRFSPVSNKPLPC